MTKTPCPFLLALLFALLLPLDQAPAGMVHIM